MAESQDTEIMAAYGEAVFDGHLLEDALKLHLVSCAQLGINGFAVTPDVVKGATFKELINYLPSVYNGVAHPDVPKIVKGLHLIRLIRNQLAHAFIHNLHAEIRSEEGRDQVIALLRRVSLFTKQSYEGLWAQHREICKDVLEADFMRVFDLPDETLPEGRLATSHMQSLLEQFQNLHFGKA
jgi:hypothetical protein